MSSVLTSPYVQAHDNEEGLIDAMLHWWVGGCKTTTRTFSLTNFNLRLLGFVLANRNDRSEVVVVEATRWDLPRAVLGSSDHDNDVFGLSASSGVASLRVVGPGDRSFGVNRPARRKAITEPVVCWLECCSIVINPDVLSVVVLVLAIE
jgi:hypothetical protein